MTVATITTASGATWQEVAAARQTYRDGTISAVSPAVPDVPTKLPLNVSVLPGQLLTKEEIAITESTVDELLSQVRDGKLSSVTVTNAFLRRAGLAQKLANCVTELLPKRSLSRAKYLDEYLAEHKKPIGPLHGLPISVKEHVTMGGLDTNAGFVSWVGKVGAEDALILQILWNAGAVFHARTTEPQSLMHLETSSNIFGVTVNPFNTSLTAGGSSGGEGALIGLRGSVLGIGTDIGGSIRSPAANNGIYGFKPTSYRLPVAGWSATMAGSEQIVPCIGPMSTSLEGLQLFMKTVIASRPWLIEPSLLPFEWKDQSQLWKKGGKKLKIAVLWDDGVVKPHPPVLRGLREVVDKLKASENVDVVEWTPYKHDEAWPIIANLYFSDGGGQELAAIAASDEPLRPLTEFIITQNPHLQHHTVDSLWAASNRRNTYRDEYAAHWNATATGLDYDGIVDVILCPATPSAAPKLETAKYWGYTSQWNLLDYPAVVFPVGTVDAEKDRGEAWEARNEKDSYNKSLWDEHGVEGWKDAPISLQLVGRRYEDEKVLRALEVLKEEVGL